MRHQPGLIFFLGGVACLVASTALGLYLAREAQSRAFRPNANDSLSYDQRLDGIHIGPDETILANVNALMWLVFGLGACLTLVGLRMFVRPDLAERPLPPIGPIREVFENPE